MLYVRPITVSEGKKLQDTVRRGKDITKLRRAQMILVSSQGMPVPDRINASSTKALLRTRLLKLSD